jgi:hypothetical protein
MIWQGLPETPAYPPTDEPGFAATRGTPPAPALYRGQNAAWEVVRAGRQSPEAGLAYLSAAANQVPAQVWVGAPEANGRFFYTEDLTGLNFERRLASLPAIVAALRKAVVGTPAQSIFAGAINLARHVPGLAGAVPMSLLPADQHRLTSLWIGTPSRTAAHWDYSDNLACPVLGARTFLLFPPEALPDLYLGPIDWTPAGQPVSMVDCAQPDLIRYPRYARALERAQVARLAPGDALFIPSMWFHYVVSSDPVGAQVNFWWYQGSAQRPPPMNSLMHALLTLREASPEERRAWQMVFEHFVFGDPEGVAAHLPVAARGVLDPANTAAADQLRQLLDTTPLTPPPR